MSPILSQRNAILINALSLIAWRYFHVDLSKLDIFKKLGSTFPNHHLALVLTALLIYLNIDLILSNCSDSERKSNWKIRAFTLGVSLSAAIVSSDAIFSGYGFTNVTQLLILSAFGIGLLTSLFTSLLAHSLECAIAFKKIRGRTTPQIMKIPIITLLALTTLFILLGIYNQKTHSDAAVAIMITLATSLFLSYPLIRKKNSVLSDENMKELRVLSNDLDRRVEMSDYYYNSSIAYKPSKQKIPHRNVMRAIQKREAEAWKETHIHFEFIKDFRINVLDEKIKDPNDEVEVIKLTLTNKKDGKSNTTAIKEKYLKKSIIEFISKSDEQWDAVKIIEDKDTFAGCLLVARRIQQMTEGNPNEMLLYCTSHGPLDDVKSHVISFKPDLNYQDNAGWCALMVASANGELEKVQFFLQKGARPNARNSLGASSLSFASHYGKLEICQILAEFGADVNLCTNDGRTPLMDAAAKGHTSVVSWLLDAGADPNRKDVKGETALAYAERGHFGEIAKLLRRPPDEDKENDRKKSPNSKRKLGPKTPKRSPSKLPANKTPDLGRRNMKSIVKLPAGTQFDLDDDILLEFLGNGEVSERDQKKVIGHLMIEGKEYEFSFSEFETMLATLKDGWHVNLASNHAYARIDLLTRMYAQRIGSHH